MQPSPSALPAASLEPASTVVAGMRVDAGTYATATEQVLAWARHRQSRYVCIANVHMVMETRDRPSFREIVNRADLVTSDGMPLVWMLRWRGCGAAQRVYGPDLMLQVCAAAAEQRVTVALFGGTAQVLARLAENLVGRFPTLEIVAKIAPPFGSFDPEQNAGFVKELEESGARIIFVGLGCPKQERWMAAMTDRLPAVLLGVGAAFNFHAGQVKQSPGWLQRAGLEWLFRLAMEPRRLWRRYLWHNPRFIWTIACEEWRRRRTRSNSAVATKQP